MKIPKEHRKDYTDETLRTLPLMEGRTIKSVLTMGSFDSPGEVTGLRITFTDGTEVTMSSDITSNGATGRSEGPISVLDVSRSKGLYDPRNPRQSPDATGKLVELS